MKKSILLTPMLALLCGANAATPGVSYVPLKFRTVSGIRPFVEIRMGGVPFLMMVHSNARFIMMTTHANATKAGVANARHLDSYGISSPGHVSELGRDQALLPRLEVAGKQFENSPILVFEIPQNPPVDGILGVRWLKEHGVILDFDRQRFGVPASAAVAQAEDQRLIAEGYVPHQLTYDKASETFVIEGSADGRPALIEISTVGENVIDIDFARAAGIPLGPVIDTYSGPKGSLGEAYIAKRVVNIVVDGQRTVPDRPQIFDTYAYDSSTRSASPDPDHTMRLAADFLLANQAVIDFGTGTLFLRPTAVTEATIG